VEELSAKSSRGQVASKHSTQIATSPARSLTRIRIITVSLHESIDLTDSFDPQLSSAPLYYHITVKRPSLAMPKVHSTAPLATLPSQAPPTPYPYSYPYPSPPSPPNSNSHKHTHAFPHKHHPSPCLTRIPGKKGQAPPTPHFKSPSVFLTESGREDGMRNTTFLLRSDRLASRTKFPLLPTL
jgi:hypothetical protein